MSGETDDGDAGQLWRDVHAAQRQKRAENRERSAGALTEAGISYVVKNDGAHLIVADQWDFWPGTGLWMNRGNRRQHGRGVFRLISRIKSAGEFT